MVWENSYDEMYEASNALTLEDSDKFFMNNSTANHWVGKKDYTGHGFTMKVDPCKRWIAGFRLKNIGPRPAGLAGLATRKFSISGSLHENGSWEELAEEELSDTRTVKAELLNFTFHEPKKIQFLKFDLISLWGDYGGLHFITPILGSVIFIPNICQIYIFNS